MDIKIYDFPRPSYIENAKKSVFAAVFPLLILTPGSGGAITLQGVNQLGRWVHNPTVRIEHRVGHKTDTRSPAEKISAIRLTYGLNMSELADLLGVTRPTVYAWLNGQEPKPESLLHIHRLTVAINEIEKLRIRNINKLTRRPIFEGRSLLDKIKANENIHEALLTISALAAKEVTARNKQKGSGKSKKSILDVGADFSSAIYDRS